MPGSRQPGTNLTAAQEYNYGADWHKYRLRAYRGWNPLSAMASAWNALRGIDTGIDITPESVWGDPYIRGSVPAAAGVADVAIAWYLNYEKPKVQFLAEAARELFPNRILGKDANAVYIKWTAGRVLRIQEKGYPLMAVGTCARMAGAYVPEAEMFDGAVYVAWTCCRKLSFARVAHGNQTIYG